MMRATALALLLGTVAWPAAAESTLERLETVAVAMNQMMFDGLVADIPALEGNMPSPEWTDELRAAYTCMYDDYVALAGDAAVADMVTSLEETLATTSAQELLQGGAAVENPAGITDQQAREIVTNCGMMDAFMAHMRDSGVLDIMMQANP